MIDYFAMNKASYAHLTDEDIVSGINQYCARLTALKKYPHRSAFRTGLSEMFLGFAHGSADLLNVANKRFGIENPKHLNPHHFLSQIAQAAERKGIKNTEHIVGYADIYNRTQILLRQMPDHKTSGIQGIFTAIRTSKNVAASQRPRL